MGGAGCLGSKTFEGGVGRHGQGKPSKIDHPASIDRHRHRPAVALTSLIFL